LAILENQESEALSILVDARFETNRSGDGVLFVAALFVMTIFVTATLMRALGSVPWSFALVGDSIGGRRLCAAAMKLARSIAEHETAVLAAGFLLTTAPAARVLLM